MKYKTLFRLALKVFGVFFLGSGLSSLPEAAGYLMMYVGSLSPPLHHHLEFWGYVSYLIGPVASIAIGLYLFFRGEWIVNRAIPSNKPYCHECGYPLKDLKGARCPECDTPFKPESSATG